MNTLEIYPFIIETIRVARPLVETIARRDRSLGAQLRDALASIALNCAEGASRDDGNQRVRFATAMGSANECAAGLATGEALGYVGGVEEVVDRLDRIARTMNKLSKR